MPPSAATSADPAQQAPELRLLLPTAATWVVTALLLDLDLPATGPLLAASALAALLAVALFLHAHRRRPPDHPDAPDRPHRSAGLAAAVLLTASAATACTVLHTGDLHRGPIAALAHPVGADPAKPHPVTLVTLDLTITGDPHLRTSHSRGANPGRPLLVVEATADLVTTDTGTTTRTRTPLTVIVQDQDTPAWRPLLPSARVRTQARVLPQRADGGSDTAAAVVAKGPLRQLAPPSAAQRLAGRLRAGLRQACAGLPADARALLPGLVVGDTSAMPEDLDEAFRATDLVHITAVSGANLSIVLALLLGAPALAGTAERGGLAALLGIPLRVAAVLGIGLTAAFVTLCRPDPSVLRAAATGLLSLLALALGRPRKALSALAAGVLALLLLDPFLARSFGFLLSVLATVGLLTLGRRWGKALQARGWPHHLAEAVACTAAAQVLCAPAAVLLAPRISLVGIPCNLLAELAVAPATLLGFAALAVAPFCAPPAAYLAGMAGYPTGWLALVARGGAALPGAELAWTPGWRGTVTLVLALAAACFAARLLRPAPAAEFTPAPEPAPDRAPDPAGTASLLDPPAPGPRPRRLLRRAVCAGLVLGLVLLLLRPPALVRIATGWPPTGARLVMCSVGQGDLLVLPVTDSPDTAVVVDTGPDPAAADACLRDLGVVRVPLVLLTHFHADHSGGLSGVLRHRAVGAIETTTLAAPEAEAAKVTALAAAARVPVLRVVPGERRTVGPELSWQVLWPAGPLGPDTAGPNNASVSLLVTAGQLRFALLGDLEPAAQAALLRAVRPRPVDVLKVAHHGSANQDWALARALHPRLALISVGAGNSYGHPAARTVNSLRALGATVLRTDRAGDIAVLGDSPATLRALTHAHPEEAEE
ncbi:ComEC/Rec2 family competence protein [Kitasatospora viridis]|uniref:Competence protein ComEC n=1 Tax=Kitasatospora viridis TaxID=281105 RepID=A0A561UL49_9ACTN|nr:ComEC/Rec2 family competence protein [Kitasatospora viridis]TWG00091.1 competence protein ComEC [Kitasatospora viridis]